MIDHINAMFEDGRITGIIGRNGFGKTVLFKMSMEALMDLARIKKTIGRDTVRETIVRVGLDPDTKKIGKLCDKVYEMDQGRLVS